MKFLSSARANQCCQGRIDNSKAATLAAVGTVFVGLCLALFCSAFAADPHSEVAVECQSDYSQTVLGETLQVLVTFTMGFVVCFVARRHRELLMQLGRFSCFAKSLSFSVRSALSSSMTSFSTNLRRFRYVGESPWISSDFKAYATVALFGIICLCCAMGLAISAFIIDPDVEPLEKLIDDGEIDSSKNTKAFIAGWTFVCMLQIRRKLMGKVGTSCLLHPF